VCVCTCACVCVCVCVCVSMWGCAWLVQVFRKVLLYRVTCYGVASRSRLLKVIGLFCKRALQKRLYSAKETYNLKKSTNRNHPILRVCLCVREKPLRVCERERVCVRVNFGLSLSFAENRLFCRVLLQRRPLILREKTLCVCERERVRVCNFRALALSLAVFCRISSLL